jgi:hypothetical protein
VIRVERDPEFWTAIASHPAVAPTLLGLPAAKVGALARRPDMLPLASDHGGFLFARLDTLGFACELHTLFTPEGRGREALIAGVSALGAVWALGYQIIVTFEARANARSQPPKSFGFRQAGDWRTTPVGDLRTWTLTQSGWTASPARRLKCLP